MMRLSKRFRGLYWRQMVVTVGMVLLTLTLLGAAFFSLSYNYARGQKTDELESRARIMSQLSVSYLEGGRYLSIEERATTRIFSSWPPLPPPYLMCSL